ncbi:MAG: cytochrome d ubiquinol oxidase subunit II, partial [Stutzerimonas stutzeri]
HYAGSRRGFTIRSTLAQDFEQILFRPPFGSIAAVAVIALFALGGLFLAVGVDAYRITSNISPIGPSNPLLKTVEQGGTWFANYKSQPWLLVAPVLGFLGALLALIGMRARREIATLLLSKLSIFGIISTVGVSMFPFILPSSIDPRSSLTVWDASSSHQTLFIMLVATMIFLPIIIAYTSWVYKVLWGKVDEESVTNKNGHAY